MTFSPTHVQWAARILLIAIGLFWLIVGDYVLGGIILGIGLVLSVMALLRPSRV